MRWVTRFYRSTIGKKIVMAVTGIILLGYLVVHVAGNMLVYGGAEAMDGYAALLKSAPLLVWSVRAILLVAVILHADSAFRLIALNRRARGRSYREWEPERSTFASRTMRYGGILLFVFIIYHILHFTVGVLHPTWPDFDVHTVYRNLVTGLQVWWVALFYILAMAALTLHLIHGIWSGFQTLGLNHPRWNAVRRPLALVVGLLIGLAFMSIPIAVWLGVVQ